MWLRSKEAGMCAAENDDQPESGSFRNEISIQLDAILIELQAARLAGDSDAVRELEVYRDSLVSERESLDMRQQRNSFPWLSSLLRKIL